MNVKLRMCSLLGLLLCSVMGFAQIEWHNPLAMGTEMIRGRWWQTELSDSYRRFPPRAQETIPASVYTQSTQAAGLNIVFRTNSPEISVRYTVTGSHSFNHMQATGKSGVDLYGVDAHGTWRWCCTGNRHFGQDSIVYRYDGLTYEQDNGYGYEFHLYLPTYVEVNFLEIGVKEGSRFEFHPTSKERPIVVYGTSIAHGACSSRPGMAWSNIIDREMEHPIVNLGFSGNGRMEPEVYDLINEIDAKLCILDCLPNMCGIIDQIEPRLTAGVRKLRASHPDVPILLVDHSDYPQEVTRKASTIFRKANAEQQRVYKQLQAAGIEHLYYLSYEELGLTADSWVEGSHPNDLGMRQYADAYIKKIREILHEDCMERTVFSPCHHHRDPYDWLDRHEKVLAYNQTEQPEILLIGNSITHYWGGNPKAHIIRGEKSWNKLFKGKKVSNMGFGWDRVENGLWRIYHDELYGFKARKIFLFLGTNNIGRNTPEEIVSGQLELLRAIHLRQPQAKLYMCGIMPRSTGQEHIKAVNELLPKRLAAEMPEVTFVTLSPLLGDENQSAYEPYFIDGTHPSGEGYEREAKMLKKYVNE